jgi:hypothetical protein
MDRIVLYCVLAFVMLSPVELKRWPRDQYLVRVSVSVDFSESSLQEDYMHYKVSRSDSSFKERYDSLDVSASVSGGGGGFSASASAAYGDVASSASSSTKTRSVEKSQLRKFKLGFLQIIREVTRTIHIGGVSSRTITKDYKDSVPIENDLSASELRKRAEDYLEREFGHSRTGKIRGSTFTEETCIKKKKGYEIIPPTKLCSDSGLNMIWDKKECKKATEEKGGYFYSVNLDTVPGLSVIDMSLFPSGCMFWYYGDGKKAGYVNRLGSHGRNARAFRICKSV